MKKKYAKFVGSGITHLFAATVAALTLVNSAQGTTITFTDRTAFNAAVAALFEPITTEGYETYPNDLQSGARTILLSYFNVSYNLSGNDSQFGVTDVLNPGGGSMVGPTAGSKYLDANYPTASGPANATVSFLFGTGINVFGTDIKDLEINNLTYSSSVGAGTAATAGADGNVQFFGIISDSAFTSIDFTEASGGDGDGVVFDQTSFARPSAVPDNGSTAMLLSVGLAGLSWFRRKIQKS